MSKPFSENISGNKKTFGLQGLAPPIEYVCGFIHQYSSLKKKYRHLPGLSDDDLGHLTKAAWKAFSLNLSPDEFLITVFTRYQQMPTPSIPTPNKLSTEFAAKVAEYEQIKMLEVPPEIRAQELIRKTYGRDLKQDDTYKEFISEFKSLRIEDIEDVEFKAIYCQLRDVQTTGEPSEFIQAIEEKIVALMTTRGINEQ